MVSTAPLPSSHNRAKKGVATIRRAILKTLQDLINARQAAKVGEDGVSADDANAELGRAWDMFSHSVDYVTGADDEDMAVSSRRPQR